MEFKKSIKTVIIDDEVRARETISEMLAIYCPEVEIIGQGVDVLSGLQAIKKLNPDLVFLDIKMPDGTGFDLLKRIDKKNFALVFLTAFDEYAIKAFKFSAVDYLLKPLDPEELVRAVTRVEQNMITTDNQITNLLENISEIKRDSKKIVLKTAESIYLVNVSDIIHCESTGNYTKFYLVNQKPVLVSKTLKDYDELLSSYGFFRVHQSHLVNIKKIVRFDKADGGTLILTHDQKVPVSTRRKDALLKVLSEI